MFIRRALLARLFTPLRLALLATGLVLTFPAIGAEAVTTAFGPLEAAQPLTARGLAERIRQDGAHEVARMLTREREWPRVRRAVAAGWENWIALLPDLIPAADQATGRALQGALRRALPRNPRAVLAILDRTNSAELGGRTICAPVAEPASWRPRALTAIRGVHDIHLIDQGADCLHALEEVP
ncbi:hypothetical protein [Gluconacetobacter takamatsuzukensis]|uniref:Uncharacterized protein n=1 Tax=Gluconacetobacter takamatsuzukensis TaxID=1286190 RepID=A0A7W4PRQ0_9PROT|nr:hypothetical protein [Gluconacetobacter takamatsuzukensis]MBB2204116.1 hypothetical protein [Gluconacetobacter takamatsuzukensis]